MLGNDAQASGAVVFGVGLFSCADNFCLRTVWPITKKGLLDLFFSDVLLTLLLWQKMSKYLLMSIIVVHAKTRERVGIWAFG